MEPNSVPQTILVVDDNPLIRDLLAQALTRAGFLTARAPDGEEALGWLAAVSFDAVVSDVCMPRMDGLELLEQIRTRFPQLPVVLMTGSSTEVMREAALAFGATALLEKPVASDDLIAAVVHALRGERTEMAGARSAGIYEPGCIA